MYFGKKGTEIFISNSSKKQKQQKQQSKTMNNTAETVENDNIENNEKTENEKFQIGNFQGKAMEQDEEQKHSLSLRLPMKWHRQMEQRAKELNAPVSYVYRMAIARFM